MGRNKGATKKQSEPRQIAWLRPVLRVVVGVALLATVVAAGDWLLQPENLPLNSVRILGKVQYLERDDLHEAIAPHAQNGFLRVDIAALQNAIESLPWVDRARVRRSWPDVLVVTISEQRPLARWGSLGLVNDRGDFFPVARPAAFAQLPLLRGPDGRHGMVVERYLKMRRMLEPAGLEIKTLVMDERRAMTVGLNNDIDLLLGRDDAYPRLLRFVRVYSGVFAARQEAIDRIDLRYTNGLAVRWREERVDETV